jgi:hypothetical protein
VLFVVDSGLCTVDSTGTCFRSPNYPSNYGDNQQCTITAHEAVTLSVTAFSTESCCDKLTVNGVQYSGTSGPDGVQVVADSTITWTSDSFTSRTGFEVCGAFPLNSSEPGRGVWLRGAPVHGR